MAFFDQIPTEEVLSLELTATPQHYNAVLFDVSPVWDEPETLAEVHSWLMENHEGLRQVLWERHHEAQSPH